MDGGGVEWRLGSHACISICHHTTLPVTAKLAKFQMNICGGRIRNSHVPGKTVGARASLITPVYRRFVACGQAPMRPGRKFVSSGGSTPSATTVATACATACCACAAAEIGSDATTRGGSDSDGPAAPSFCLSDSLRRRQREGSVRRGYRGRRVPWVGRRGFLGGPFPGTAQSFKTTVKHDGFEWFWARGQA